MRRDYDAIIIGGGFFGCCLALFLRSVSARVLVLESGDELLRRASRVNQARVHTGFHYPRSFATALRSRVLHERFNRDFAHAVFADFDMLYAIAARRSKVSASRFAHTFAALGAPFAPAPKQLRGLFEPELIEQVFLCREYAFDWRKLRDGLLARLDTHGIQIELGECVDRVENGPACAAVTLRSGRTLSARSVFNVTYAGINTILIASGLQPVALKHELAEVALVDAPVELDRLGVTVMDGPFFSCMPYPAESCYSLTHVRYTPHYSWVDRPGAASTQAVADKLPRETRWRHMVQDARRYLPAMAGARYRDSLFDIKTVLARNERDDGRPILLRRHDDCPRLFTILGAKIDNIFDLFEALPEMDAFWAGAHADRVLA